MLHISMRFIAAGCFVLAGYLLAYSDWGLAIAGISLGAAYMWT